MISHPFVYRAPTSVAEAVEILAEAPTTSRVIGGGTWVVPECNRGESRPEVLVDLRHTGLHRIEVVGDVVHVGATATYSALMSSPDVARHLPLLAAMANGITGGRQIQSQGTVGGSVVAARPSSDAPAAVAALDATFVIAGPDGERRVSGAGRFQDASVSCLREGEILTRLEFPVLPAARWGYYKLKRSASSWPIATAACVLGETPRLVLGAVSPTPVHVDLGSVLSGGPPTPETIELAVRLAADSVATPWADELAPATYRAAVAGPVARRAIEMAAHQESR
ncbi:xanthine dehydrogenase family protein subunit M [Nocardioides hungaricus]